MTDRVKALIVHLDKDYREDDLDALADAIHQFRGVENVSKSVSNWEDRDARLKVACRVRDQLFDLQNDLVATNWCE